MKRLNGIALGASLIATTVLASVGCSLALGDAPDKDQPPSAYAKTIEDFVKNGSTYKFDGIDGSLKVVKVAGLGDGTWDYTVEYRTSQPGHGDRTGQILAQVITSHTAEIEIRDGQIASAVCDADWNIASGDKVSSDSEGLTMPAGAGVDGSGDGSDLSVR